MILKNLSPDSSMLYEAARTRYLFREIRIQIVVDRFGAKDFFPFRRFGGFVENYAHRIGFREYIAIE
jgi:hypothetical protein